LNLSILDAAQQCPEREYIVTPERTLTYAQMAQRVERTVSWLRSTGVRPGQEEPFALEATSALRTIEILLSLMELGVPALLLHPRWTELERASVLKRAGVSVPSLPDSFGLIPAGPPPSTSLPVKDPESCLAVVYTSGTTGVPKGVRLSRRAFVASARSTSAAVPVSETDRWLLCMPLAHVGGLSIITRCLLARATVVLQPSAPSKGFDPASVWRLMQDQEVTLVSLVPTQLQRLLDASLRAPSSLRLVLLGGASCPPQLLARAAEHGWAIRCTYGLTEACSAVTIARADGASAVPDSCGSALPGVELRIEAGRIHVRSAALLSGYYPEATGAALDDDGWFVTADCGQLVDGDLRVLGRHDDVIVTGGENVHPLEVERELLLHPGIDDACVFGLSDEHWGQVVAAAIVAKAPAALCDLLGWLEPRLARFKLPRKIAVVEALPLTPTGKVNRLRCRQLFGTQCRDISELSFESGAPR